MPKHRNVRESYLIRSPVFDISKQYKLLLFRVVQIPTLMMVYLRLSIEESPWETKICLFN